MKRILVVNWRWEKKIKTDDTSLQIKGLPDNDNLYLSNYDSSIGLNGFLGGILNDCQEQDECIVLSHLSDNSEISIPKDEVETNKSFTGILKVYNFSGGDGMPYYGTSNQEGLFHPTNEYLYIKNFEKVWNYYKIELELEFQKKKLINIFLPLAIDMQGLTQMSNNEKRKQYQEEIIQDIKLNGDKIIKEWNEIKEVLAIDNSEEVLSEEYQLKKEEEEEDVLKFPLDKGKARFTKRKLIELFKKDSWAEKESIPNWLEKAVKILDSKIEAKNI